MSALRRKELVECQYGFCEGARGSSDEGRAISASAHHIHRYATAGTEWTIGGESSSPTGQISLYPAPPPSSGYREKPKPDLSAF